MRAITCLQPYATAMVSGLKPIENRPWVPRSLLGQRIAVHAGLKVDGEDRWGVLDQCLKHGLRKLLAQGLKYAGLPQGAILGTVVLKGWIKIGVRAHPAGGGELLGLEHEGLTQRELRTAMKSPWRSPSSPCLWVLSEPRGGLSHWPVPDALAASLLIDQHEDEDLKQRLRQPRG